MKRLLYLTFAICMACNAYGHHRSIPAWVKEKVSPAEYKLWEEINDYYVIDFDRQSLLKCRHLMPEQFKKEEAIIDMLQTTYRR